MKCIVGLGNPGMQYERTRHNVGFRVLDALASRHNWSWERRGRAMVASGILGTEKILLIKPLTYMNKSGEAVGELARFYKIEPGDILVVYDEVDLPTGKVRLRPKGSAGGHNGLSSIIQHLHTDQFPRLRIGIGRPTNSRIDTATHVLTAPTGEELQLLETGESRAIDALPLIIQQGVEAAMNLVNPDPEDARKSEERRRQKEQRRLQKQQEAVGKGQVGETTPPLTTGTEPLSDPI